MLGSFTEISYRIVKLFHSNIDLTSFNKSFSIIWFEFNCFVESGKCQIIFAQFYLADRNIQKQSWVVASIHWVELKTFLEFFDGFFKFLLFKDRSSFFLHFSCLDSQFHLNLTLFKIWVEVQSLNEMLLPKNVSPIINKDSSSHTENFRIIRNFSASLHNLGRISVCLIILKRQHQGLHFHANMVYRHGAVFKQLSEVSDSFFIFLLLISFFNESLNNFQIGQMLLILFIDLIIWFKLNWFLKRETSLSKVS